MTRIVVLASGSGTNLQALIDAEDEGRLGSGRIAAVISDRPAAQALQRAAQHGRTYLALPPADAEPRSDYDRRLAQLLSTLKPDIVVLAGWMRILTSAVVASHRVINLHPALPGELPGIRAIERAYDEFAHGLRSRTGVMIHEVPDEGVDSGPTLAVEEVPIIPGDQLTDLEARIHQVEHRLLVDTVARLCEMTSTTQGGPHDSPE